MAEMLVYAAVAATAIYLTTPEGQDAIRQLSELLGTTIQSFVSTAKGFSDQLEEAIEYFYQVQCAIVENVEKIVDEAVKSDNPNKEWNKNTVYVHYDTVTGKVYYVGRTKNFDRRYREHAKKVLGFYVSKHPIGNDINRDMIPVVTGLTSIQSKIVEQILISSFSLEALENMRRGISGKNWGKVLKEANRISELLEVDLSLGDLIP